MQTNQQYKKQIIKCLRPKVWGGERLTARGHEGTFWSDRNALNHNCGHSYTAVSICQSSSHCLLNMGTVYYQ